MADENTQANDGQVDDSQTDDTQVDGVDNKPQSEMIQVWTIVTMVSLTT